MSILDGESGPSPDDFVNDYDLEDPSLEELSTMEEEYSREGSDHPELADYYKLLDELGIDENDPESYNEEHDVP